MVRKTALVLPLTALIPWRMATLIVASVALAACDGGGSGRDGSGVSASEADALNNAADMLDSRASPQAADASPAS